MLYRLISIGRNTLVKIIKMQARMSDRLYVMSPKEKQQRLQEMNAIARWTREQVEVVKSSAAPTEL